MTSHVGTINAVLKSADSLAKKIKIYIVDVIGEFNHIKSEERKM